MYALKALGVLQITQYIITCIQISQVVKMSLLNRHYYKLVTSRQLVSFGYRQLSISPFLHSLRRGSQSRQPS